MSKPSVRVGFKLVKLDITDNMEDKDTADSIVKAIDRLIDLLDSGCTLDQELSIKQ